MTTQSTMQSAIAGAPHKDVQRQVGHHLALRSFIGYQKDFNEDFGIVDEVKIDDSTFHILIVCDGVSTSRAPHLAAEAACNAAHETILVELRSGNRQLDQCLSLSINAAQKSVSSLSDREEQPSNIRKCPPQTAFIAAIVNGTIAAIIWIGDCRAYMLPRSGGARLLTKDHSWINLLIETEGLSVLQAMLRPEAHWITRCLGQLESGLNIEPSHVLVDISNGKMLMLCSDGFWNYGHPRQDQRATPFLDQMHGISENAAASTIATRLVDFACDSGGHDNITVAVLKLCREGI